MPSKRSYIALDNFGTDIFTYSTQIVNFNTVGTLTPIGGGNCQKGHFLHETGRKLYPGANPGVSTYMVAVYNPVSFVKGYIDPNSKVFSPMNTDKSYAVQIEDGKRGVFGTNPNGGTESDKGPGILTLANCEISGTLNVKNEYYQYGYVLVPKFTVVMWAGTVVAIPDGWLLCDGRTATLNGSSVTAPDLRGRFVLSYGQGPLDFVNTTIGATGGEQKHTLSLAEIPSHSHGIKHGYDDKNFNNATNQMSPGDGNANIVDGYPTEAAGGGNGHNTMPPYYVLCYIMKGF
jgi:hypothetical protein